MTINTLHIEAQRLRDEALRLRAHNQLTLFDKEALDLIEAHFAAAATLLFAMGNRRDPTG